MSDTLAITDKMLEAGASEVSAYDPASWGSGLYEVAEACFRAMCAEAGIEVAPRVPGSNPHYTVYSIPVEMWRELHAGNPIA